MSVIVTVDLDWACEPAIEGILAFLEDKKITPTIFSTHNSSIVEAVINKIEIGLHPYFGTNSSHGTTISEVVKHVMDLPHNLAAFRCHRFATCNLSKQAMFEAGMLISSNVCTDLEIITPFKDRFGFLEVPISLEDGGYLWRNHPMQLDERLRNIVLNQATKVITIHPMHFAINTPYFAYMYDIKQSVSREEWKNMTKSTLNKLKWQGYGIRNLIIELLGIVPETLPLRTLITTS
ncbi:MULTISPECIES: hypothetical protein [unclassified Candidatus Tisiphia]|uniref:polysaccharide deacetylase WbmS family protein n=1 Tax=unclassified Candidatus Tisiphia TaxID=2996318 RepID=UPI001E7F5523|nr:MAG: hypothetical protein LF884_02345 [Rickettsia endosymbiont of Cimex lectularius]